MELMQGQPDYNLKLEDGSPISRKAAEHMSKHRVRCHECNSNFCANCSAAPYHTGKTCEEFKEFKEARKCRYCNDKITQAPPSMKPAFKDVCRKEECIQLMNKSCDKVLQCGHYCCGFVDEP